MPWLDWLVAKDHNHRLTAAACAETQNVFGVHLACAPVMAAMACPGVVLPAASFDLSCQWLFGLVVQGRVLTQQHSKTCLERGNFLHRTPGSGCFSATMSVLGLMNGVWFCVVG